MIDLHLSAFAPRWRFLYVVRIDAYEDTSIDSFISGFELAWKLFMELNYYENERSVSCRTAMELRARFASKEEEK